MDRKRAAAALLALAACIACSAAAPTASNQTALELMNGPTEGCYYNFQHYGEGDRIMTNEPCLNCTCHNRMLMCYLRVCPFTKPIGQDCTVEKRADQCCPIVTCPDVPVDLLTSTSTSSPAEYGTTGVGKLDKYGCSINGKYFSEGSKVPSTPNKPCEHCYCIRNMTTCVMQECTLHVDGCTPIYHKEVCCPVRYSCDHPEDDILLLDDMTTTVRPTPGFLLTTTTAMPVTQITQDCVHDDQIFPDGTLIKTEKACEHCYCMKGDIVCVVQECGTPMENEGKNCTSLPPRHGQCCPDTYICEGDDRGTELTTEIDDHFTQPPRRVGVEGSGYRNEPDEPFTETGPFETDIEGSGEDYATDAPVITVEDGITEKIQPDIIDEILLATTEKEQISLITEPSKDQNTIPDIISSTKSSDLPETIAQATEANVELGSMGTESKTTVTDENKDNELISKDDFITTESAFRKEDDNIVSDEMLTIKEQEKLPTTSVDLVDETTLKDEYTQDASTELILQTEYQSTTLSAEYTPEIIDIIKEKGTTMENPSPSSSTEKIKSEDELAVTSEEEIFTGTTTMLNEKVDRPETTTVNPGIIEVDENIAITSPPGRIPGEGDCLLDGITYRNNTIVPSSNNCHTSCKCTSSIIKCDPIICSSPPEYMENMNDCQPIYDSPDACCPTYVCSAKETVPPQSHSQMSGTESPKPISVSDCSGQDCILDEQQKPISEPSSTCTSVDCLNKPVEKQDQGDCGLSDCADQKQKPSLNEDCPDNKCQILPVVACEGENCVNEPVTDLDSHKTPTSENVPSLICNENGDCKKPEDTQQDECKDENCRKQENIETEEKVPSECGESECKTHEKLPPSTQLSTDLTTEKIAIDKVTEISLNELDTDTEFPVKTISTSIEDNITEHPTPGVTKVPETVSSEKLTTISETSSNTEDTTDKTDQTELQTNQSIPEKSDDTKITDPTNIEHVTESSQDASEDKMTKVDNMTDRTITDKETIHHETSEHTEIKSEDNFTDKIETTTEILEIFTDSNLYSTKHDEVYPTTAELDTEKQKTHTEIPELDKKELEKLTTTEANAIKEVSELYEIKEDKTELPVTLDAITTQTEKISIDFDKATDIYESQVTNKPNEQFVETYTEKEKATETPKLNHTEPHEIITENNGEIADVSPPSESHMTKDKEITTDKSAVTLESNIIPTDLPQSMQTKLDEVTKDVTQESITDKHETYTEASEQFTTKAEETKSEQSEHHIDNLSTTQIKSEVTEESITEKVTTVTESTETLQTKPEEIIHDFEQTVTEKQEAYTETPAHLVEKLDGTSTAATVEKEIEDTVTEKQEAYTETPDHLVEKLDGTSTAATVEKEIEDTVTEKQEAYTETPEHLVEKLDDTSTAVTVEKEIEDTVTEKQEAYTETPEHLVEKLDGTSTAVTVEKEIEDTVTEKQEAYTETPEHLVEKLDDTSTAATVEKEIEDTVTEKQEAYTETPEHLVEKLDDTSTTVTVEKEIEDTVTEKQEAYTETPEHLVEKFDGTSTAATVEKEIEDTETEKEFTDTIEYYTTEKQEIHTEVPKVYTTIPVELFTKDYDIKTESGTELPTLLTTSGENLKQPGYQDIPKESEEPITEKESHISDDIIHTTSETDKVSITKKDQYFTEKSENIVTEPTPAHTLIEDHSFISPTSNEANEVDEQEIDSDNLATTIQNNVMTHEITTITEEIITVTESQSKSPSLSDGKHQESSTEIQEELPLQTDVNDMDTATQSPQKLDESFITSPAPTTSQSEVTTEHYATESQKIHAELTDETQSQLDSSTKPSLFDHKLDESKDTSKPHEETEEIISKPTTSKPPEIIEEIISKPTTTIPQDEQKKIDKEPTILTGPEKTSQDLEKTTDSSISGEEKETNPLPYITESYINLKEKETAAPTTGIIIDKELNETTEKSASEGEHLPHPTHEYIPVEGITEEITSQTLHDISTEKTKLQDTFETPAPIDIETIRPELFTKPEESHITETTVFAKEKEIATELPNSYTTTEDLNKISPSTHKDQLNENTYKPPESEKDEQVLTTSTALRPEEDKEVTKAPISIVTDIEHITETSIPEKNEIDIESTTKISDDRISEVEKEQTISELYTTESQTETSEKSRDEITQEQETNKDKILTTENPEKLSTSYLHETTISSFEGDVKVTQQETMTEKSADQTEPISNVQSTSSESDLQNPEGTPVSTSKDEIINKEEQKTTPKSLEDFEQVTPHTPEHLTTILVSKDEITTELSNKEISTTPPKLLEPEKDGDHEVTEIISNDQRTTTMYPEKQHDIVTEKEKTPENLDIEAHVITTETIKPSVTERDDVDIVTYSSTESIPTDKPTVSVTASKESDILEEEHKTTGIPVFNEIQTSTQHQTETQEISETESPTKGVEAIESHYTTVADREESSTDTTDIKDKEPEHNITDDQKLTTTVPKDVELSTGNEDSEIKKSQSTSITYHPETTTSVTVAEYSEAHGKDKFTTIITEDTNINIESTKPTITEEEKLDLPDIHSTQSTMEIQTEEHVTQKESDKITTESVSAPLPNVNIATELPTPTEKHEEPYDTEENKQMTDSEYKLSETTPFLVELEEHTHRVADEITTKASLEEIATTMLYETHESQQPERGDQIPDDLTTYKDEYPISVPSKTTVTGLEDKEQPTTHIQEQIDIDSTVIPSKSETETPLITDKTPTSTSTYELVDTKKDTTIHDDNVVISTTSQMIKDKDYTTESIEIHQTSSSTLDDGQTSSDKDIHIASEKPLSPEISEEKLTTEMPKDTTNKVGEDTSTYSPSHIDNVTKPKEKPFDTTLRPAIPEVPKPEFIDEHNEEIPSPDFPPSGGYGQEPDYIDEDQAFGPGTCRYGGKVYVSAQQIPRDDPCDFCFCFRSDIICLQQSCPPPIHGCHEEPIQGFCCPRYECPVSMATTLNVTTTTTTTTTTLPPHFLPHAYKGAAQRRGCQIKGHTYKVGEVVRASSGPCLHCTCGGDGQMKCDPKACTPEPMLRQMIAAAVSAKRRR